MFDLASYDLQGDASHTITIAIAAGSQSAQDAVVAGELEARKARLAEHLQGLYCEA